MKRTQIRIVAIKRTEDDTQRYEQYIIHEHKSVTVVTLKCNRADRKEDRI